MTAKRSRVFVPRIIRAALSRIRSSYRWQKKRRRLAKRDPFLYK